MVATSCMDGLLLCWQDVAIYLHLTNCNTNLVSLHSSTPTLKEDTLKMWVLGCF